MADTVILGSGIMGLSTAYYLSQSSNTRPDGIHIIDSSQELFHCASGYAGGFLAADWFAPSVTSLGALSFKLHRDLSDRYGGRETWGYSQSTGISYSRDSEAVVEGGDEDWLSNGASRAQAATSKSNTDDGGPLWLKRVHGVTMEVISQDKSTAQVDPKRFCQFLLEQCLKRGVRLHQPAKATSVSRDENGYLDGIRISKDGTETELPCTRLIITSGAWSPRVFSSLFPKASTRIPISALAGHSLVIKNPFFKSDVEEMCHAVFANEMLGFSPEYFARVGGEVYLAGLNSTQIPLPETATEARADPDAIRQLRECATSMMGTVDDEELEVVREALCFRPVTPSGQPIISRIPERKLGGGFKTRGGAEGGVFVAAGHGPWGISLGPGTGLVLSELVEGRKMSANIDSLILK